MVEAVKIAKYYRHRRIVRDFLDCIAAPVITSEDKGAGSNVSAATAMCWRSRRRPCATACGAAATPAAVRPRRISGSEKRALENVAGRSMRSAANLPIRAFCAQAEAIPRQDHAALRHAWRAHRR
jgi:hypothetical protein